MKIRLYDELSKPGFHTSICTTFCVDFDTYENVVLSRFRDAGCPNNLLLVDAGMLALALDGDSSLPRWAGQRYSVTPSLAARGVFHPKIVLQLGPSAARVIVSSANITAPGLAGNYEIAGIVDTEDPSSNEMRLIASVWRFLLSTIDRRDAGIERQVNWALVKSPWLSKTEPASGAVTLSDRTDAAFFGTDASESIAERFLARLGETQVERLIVASPYWDKDLAAFNLLLAETDPKRVSVLLDEERQTFPPGKIAAAYRKRVDLVPFTAPKASRFVHAKFSIAQTKRSDHVLYGSANCTSAALGSLKARGINSEANLYRMLPAGAAVETLGLEKALDAKPIAHDDFEPSPLPPPIPLDELRGAFPGTFTCLYETLTWRFPTQADPAKDRIELFDAAKAALRVELRARPETTPDTKSFSIVGKLRPSFARVRRADGGHSAYAIVTLVDVLKDALRPKRSRDAERIVEQLDDRNADLGLWLLEALNVLERAEAPAPTSGSRRGKAKGDETAEPVAARKLSYDEFIAGRRLRSEAHGVQRSSLGGSDLSSVRNFLGRLLGLRMAKAVDIDDDDAALHAAAFDLGDETADAEASIEGGQDFDRPSSAPEVRPNDEIALSHARRENYEGFVYAIEELSVAVRAKSEESGLSGGDLLRLRVMLTILAAAGWAGDVQPNNTLQVLPAVTSTGDTWGLLVGRVLFAYFGGKPSPISTLKLEDDFDEVPDDVLECWATCFWSIQAAIATAAAHPTTAGTANRLRAITSKLYLFTGLRSHEMTHPRIMGVFEALSGRFASNLDLQPDALSRAHVQLTKELAILDA